MAQSWDTYIGRGDDGVYYVKLTGNDEEREESLDDGIFDVGSAKDLVRWIEDDSQIEPLDIQDDLAKAPEMAEVVEAITARYEHLDD